MDAGRLRLDLSFQGTWAEDRRVLRCPEFSPSVCADIDLPDHVRRSTFAALRWQGTASIGLGKGFSIAASLPLVLKSFDVAHSRLDGSAYDVPYSLLSGVSGPIVGLGDATVMARLSGRVPNTPLQLQVGLGAALPTGRTSPDPFDPSLPASQRQPRQFGNGTVDPQVELGLVVGTRPFGFVAQGTTRIPLYANEHGYRGQWTLGGSAGLLTTLPEPLRSLVLLLMVDASHTSPALWHGEASENSGGDQIALRLAFEWAATDTFSLRGQLVASPLQELEGEQFAAPISLGFGASGIIDLRPKAKRHGH